IAAFDALSLNQELAVVRRHFVTQMSISYAQDIEVDHHGSVEPGAIFDQAVEDNLVDHRIRFAALPATPVVIPVTNPQVQALHTFATPTPSNTPDPFEMGDPVPAQQNS